MNIHRQLETYWVALFLHCLGLEPLRIFNRMSFNNAQESKKLDNIMQKYSTSSQSTKTNEIYELDVFNSWNQSPDEVFDTYVAALRTLPQTCNFCECVWESLIRDRIVLGILNRQTRKLLRAQQVVTQYPKVFESQLGRVPGMVKIEIGANIQPVVTLHTNKKNSQGTKRDVQERSGQT